MNQEIIYQKELKLSNGEKCVVNFIEKNPEKFSKMPITQVAKETFFSISGISKLVKKMGFKHFKDWQLWIMEQAINTRKNEIIIDPKSIKDVANNIYTSYQRATFRTLSDIDEKKIKSCIKEIEAKKLILTYGTGSSALAAIELSSGLNIIGFSSTKVKTVYEVVLNMPDDKVHERCLIIFSKAFSTYDLSVIRDIMKKINCKLIIITADQKIKENDNEIIIRFRTYEQRKRITALSSRISQLMISDLIVNSMKRIKKNIAKTFFEERWLIKK